MKRVALVGCGAISSYHVRGYAAHKDRARITVCCDVDLAKANERADHAAEVWGERPSVTDDYSAILANANIDSIELCMPSHLHTEPVIAAARAGKQVLCQKPLALTLDDCARMIQAAADAGTVLYYAEFFRTWQPVRMAARLIAENKIGQVVGLQGTYAHWQGGEYAHTAWRYDPLIAGGGELIDGGIHFVDMLRTLGGPIRAVSCFTNRIRPELGGEDTAAVAFHYEGGYVGALMSMHACGPGYPGPSLNVFGTEGVLSIRGPHGTLVRYRQDLPEGREVLLEQSEDVFVSLIGHYLDVLDGQPSLCTPESGKELLAIVLAAYRSAETGRSTEVNDL